jgi:hypothetical protein
MSQTYIWKNYGLWFRVSLIAVLFWFIFSLSLCLVIYFAWPVNVNGLEVIIFNLLIWLFILPSIALFGIINCMPFIVSWIYSGASEKNISPHSLKKNSSPNSSHGYDQNPRRMQSYKDVSTRLSEEKEAHKEDQHSSDVHKDAHDYDDF